MRVTGSRVRSVADLLAWQSAVQGDHRAYTFLDSGELDAGHLTWRALDRQSGATARAIRALVDPHARVLLLFPPGLDFIAALFGAFRARVVAVAAYPPSGALRDPAGHRLRGVVAAAGIGLVVVPPAVRAMRDALCAIVPELCQLPWLTIEEDPGGHPGEPLEDGPDRHDIAVLQYTAASATGPRGVRVTHGDLLHHLEENARLGLHDSRTVSVSWLPVGHHMGLVQGVLQPAFSGFPVWLMSPLAFLQRPARWLHAISTLRATHSGAPNFAFDICARRVSAAERAALDLGSWRVAFIGSAPVGASTIDAFERAFSGVGFRRTAFRPAEAALFLAST